MKLSAYPAIGFLLLCTVSAGVFAAPAEPAPPSGGEEPVSAAEEAAPAAPLGGEEPPAAEEAAASAALPGEDAA